MELKDVILSTLAELNAAVESEIETPKIISQSYNEINEQSVTTPTVKQVIRNDEKLFLENIQERLLVLFEGFQASNNSKIEAKVDLTLNFLEYLLATIENRINMIKNKEKE